jgi:2-polyprenyl-3-methyl-5-hydroxy-6-metoxy-1,4-benzoquinol methylase
MERVSDVKGFYDEFSRKVLLEDFRRFSLRQEAVRRLCTDFVPRGARVLEIGCGVGINVKHLSGIASRVVGVDISDRNIEIAREYAGCPGVEFRVLDILDAADELVSLGPFDVIVLPDVIEHIPKGRYPDLFAAIERILHRPGWVLLTYPSPEYQRYLGEHDPEALQIVDEVVTLDEILRDTRLELVHFSYKHVWHKNQYIHAVLTSDRAYDPEELKRTATERLKYRVKKRLWRLRHFWLVRKITQRLASPR